WAAVVLAPTAWVWFLHRFAPQRRVHAWSLAGLMLGVVAACCASHWDSGDWLAQHVLTASWGVAGLGMLLVGWRAPELSSSTSTRRWVEVISALVVILALRGAWADPARPYWSVGATLTASVLLGGL